VAAAGATSATVGYKGYKHASCISVNNVVCHGIPGQPIPKSGVETISKDPEKRRGDDVLTWRHPEHRRDRDRGRLVRRHEPDVRRRARSAGRPSG
jgi:hypothetical protein